MFRLGGMTIHVRWQWRYLIYITAFVTALLLAFIFREGMTYDGFLQLIGKILGLGLIFLLGEWLYGYSSETPRFRNWTIALIVFGVGLYLFATTVLYDTQLFVGMDRFFDSPLDPDIYFHLIMGAVIIFILANFILFQRKLKVLFISALVVCVAWEGIELIVNPMFYPEPFMNMVQDVIMNVVGIGIALLVYYYIRMKPPKRGGITIPYRKEATASLSNYRIFALFMLTSYIIGWFAVSLINYTGVLLSSPIYTFRLTVFVGVALLATIFFIINCLKGYKRLAIYGFFVGIVVDLIFETGLAVGGIRVFSGNVAFSFVWHVLFEMTAGIQFFLFFAIILGQVRGWRDVL